MRMSSDLKAYARQHHLDGLTPRTLTAISEHEPGYTVERARQFLAFYKRIQREMLNHPVIVGNNYTHWFSRGDFSLQQLKAFIVQFSVFSNLFIVAQLEKTINADSLESMHASKEILVNELGVVFNNDHSDHKNIVQDEGTVEGGIFHFSAAHFEWLFKLAKELGLEFNDIGKRRHGSVETIFFCDELLRLYASEDYTTAQAASFAVENWASAGFWGELINGLKQYQLKHELNLPIFFFTYHDRIEAQHAQHTLDELEEVYFTHPVNEDEFIRAGNEMLNGVEVFWNGLDKSREYLNH